MKTLGLTHSAFERKVGGLLKEDIKSNGLEGDIKMSNKTQNDVVQETRRKLFENEYVQYRQYLKRNKDGSYNEEWVDARWQGFNAAFDLLVIELPKVTEYPRDYWGGVDDCKSNIDSLNLGIKVK